MSTQLGQFSMVYGRDGGTVVVQIAGELDASTSPQLDHGLTGLIDEQGNMSIRAEIGGLTFIDSTGLTALVRALREVRDRGGDLVLANPTPKIHRVLDMVGLTQVFSIAPDATEPPTDDNRPSVSGR